ncbi:Helicase, C-terminal [Ostreococcus tauri]|uniref:Helicase, C-terminal n=1 Tax=Ostreococcus tauri TaxID=70448 RepID=A0A090M9T8_OSTTA|nr:Helicase, C-terminal [Ostreococcus tauri]CEF98864.1 Helicase, C-terminal [Ostreococcus tauri]|eukprot:XP_022839512.1 Helicase, C-terminal [Ostreococcus tauri]
MSADANANVDEHIDPEDEIAFEDAGDDDRDTANGTPTSDYDSDADYAADEDHPMSPGVKEVAKAERERLRALKREQQAELERVREDQNKAIAQDSKAGKWKYLLAQTEVFAHFLSGTKAAKEAANKGKRGKNKSHAAEESEDAELVEHAEDYQAVRLTVQPSCIKFGKMREYQLAGLNWMIRLFDHGINGILADEMGLGKTLQTISLLGYLHEYRGITGPHMVVVPKSTLGNWMNEFKRWCPVIRTFKFHGNAEEREALKAKYLVPGGFDVCVTSYEMVIKEKNALKRFHWRYIIIDEAHRLKNENSRLSLVLRTMSANNRMLITGTPLQNNLHELWALLNFLLPEVFGNAGQFEEWFGNVEDGEEGGSDAVVQQLHKVLRPFLLRRLKTEVETSLPPKKETILKIGMTEMQKTFYKRILQKDIDIVNSGADRSRLLNIVMQLRKCCNHPYLFQGAEPGPPYITGDHLIESSGKLALLDKLLPRLMERGSRVLIFSQMTRLLDILEDYMMYRRYQYCRIDGSTDGETRENHIDAFNKEGSEKFAFLLSTRAGGLGINLATADTVIIYDSDWNPQMDLQAMDRAHRIGQKKEVQVFRFCTDGSVEEKVIEKAYKKLALDALVIQQGRLQENKKNLGKDELLSMVRFGAEKIFDSSSTAVTEEDIDAIMARGEEETKALNSKMQGFTEKAIQFSMGAENSLYEFADEEDKPAALPEGIDMKTIISSNWIDPPKRERKKNYNETDYYRNAMAQSARPAKAAGPKIAKLQQMNDFQFYNTSRIQEIYDKDVRRKTYEWNKENEKKKDDQEAPVEEKEEPNAPQPITDEEKAEMDTLLNQGFTEWSRRDFQAFCRLSEKYGRDSLDSIASELEGKTLKEVKDYAAVFWQRYKEVADHQRIISNIEKGEQKIQRQHDMLKAVREKIAMYKNPWRELKITYGPNKFKSFTEEEDRFLLCSIPEVGFGNWDELKAQIRQHWQFRFDWFIKSRTPKELGRRVETLISLIEKESTQTDKKRDADTEANDDDSAKKPKTEIEA